MRKQTILTLLIGIALGVAGTLVCQTGLPGAFVNVSAVAESEETLSGLAVGADVHIMGTLAGHVHELTPRDDERVELTLRIKRQFADFVKQDASLVVRRKFGIAGTPYIDLAVGKGERLVPAAAKPLPVVRDEELDQRTRQVVHSIASMIVDATKTNQQEVAGDQTE